MTVIIRVNAIVTTLHTVPKTPKWYGPLMWLFRGKRENITEMLIERFGNTSTAVMRLSAQRNEYRNFRIYTVGMDILPIEGR
jgi:hypothetical protein